MLTFFKHQKNVLAVLSERDAGPMSFTRPEGEANRIKFIGKLGIASEQIVSAGLVHGSAVAVVGKTALKRIPAKDALITRDPNTYLALTVGDCLPLFLYDPKAKIIALVHAGWRGIAKNILGVTMERMEVLGAKATFCELFIGPGIGKCHYVFPDKELAEKRADAADNMLMTALKKHGGFFHPTDGTTAIDLKGIVRKQFIEAGGAEKNVTVSPLCTFCEEEKFFSWRRERVHPPLTMIAVMGMRK